MLCLCLFVPNNTITLKTKAIGHRMAYFSCIFLEKNKNKQKSFDSPCAVFTVDNVHFLHFVQCFATQYTQPTLHQSSFGERELGTKSKCCDFSCANSIQKPKRPIPYIFTRYFLSRNIIFLLSFVILTLPFVYAVSFYYRT